MSAFLESRLREAAKGVAARAMAAMMKQKKIDIAVIEAAVREAG
jgi:predicted 3-demethylubiquinone-9 3-methyltransferase (glyoxalase superfamily)